MPIYDYRCDGCGHAFSVVRSFKEPPVERCPSCGKRPRRVITAPAIVFKGSGWYKTDSRAVSPSAEGGGAGEKAGKTGPEKREKTEKTEKTQKTDTGEASGTSKTAGDRSGGQASPDAGKTSAEGGKSSTSKGEAAP